MNIKEIVIYLEANGIKRKDICYMLNISSQTLYNIQIGKLTDLKLSNFIRMLDMLGYASKGELADHIIKQVIFKGQKNK
jgi:hypothetical protein